MAKPFDPTRNPANPSGGPGTPTPCGVPVEDDDFDNPKEEPAKEDSTDD